MLTPVAPVTHPLRRMQCAACTRPRHARGLMSTHEPTDGMLHTQILPDREILPLPKGHGRQPDGGTGGDAGPAALVQGCASARGVGATGRLARRRRVCCRMHATAAAGAGPSLVTASRKSLRHKRDQAGGPSHRCSSTSSTASRWRPPPRRGQRRCSRPLVSPPGLPRLSPTESCEQRVSTRISLKQARLQLALHRLLDCRGPAGRGGGGAARRAARRSEVWRGRRVPWVSVSLRAEPSS